MHRDDYGNFSNDAEPGARKAGFWENHSSSEIHSFYNVILTKTKSCFGNLQKNFIVFGLIVRNNVELGRPKEGTQWLSLTFWYISLSAKPKNSFRKMKIGLNLKPIWVWLVEGVT